MAGSIATQTFTPFCSSQREKTDAPRFLQRRDTLPRGDTHGGQTTSSPSAEGGGGGEPTPALNLTLTLALALALGEHTLTARSWPCLFFRSERKADGEKVRLDFAGGHAPAAAGCLFKEEYVAA